MAYFFALFKTIGETCVVYALSPIVTLFGLVGSLFPILDPKNVGGDFFAFLAGGGEEEILMYILVEVLKKNVAISAS